jgi:hypothetical protein
VSPPSAKYSAELRERAVRMVAEVRAKHPSEWAAISAVASELGIRNPGTLRRWVRQAESSVKVASKSAASSKWRFLRKWLLRPHPIIIGVIVTVSGGLVLTYSQLVLGANNHKPSLEVDEVSLSPGGIELPNNGDPLFRVTPFKVDVKLLNTGSQLAAINDARLVIQKFVRLPQCATQGGFGSTGSYRSNMPANPRPGTTVTIPVSQLVNPGGADRFDVLLRAPLTRPGGLLVTVYLYRIHVYLDYNPGAGTVDLGEILVDLPYDPVDGNAYFWTHFFATHPKNLSWEGKYETEIENCMIRNARALNVILTAPSKRTAMVSKIPPLLAFCCAARRNGS